MFLEDENSCSDGRELLRRFGFNTTLVLILLYALCFWAGLIFLREDLFKHFFNPSRHLIVAQNPNTFEILAWKDALGNVYTPEDIQANWVKLPERLITCLQGSSGCRTTIK